MENKTGKEKEGNKLIAEFMGYRNVIYPRCVPHEVGNGIVRTSYIGDDNVWEHLTDSRLNFCYPEYHTSWDWLMPSWRKCYDRLLEINSTSSHFYIDKMKEALGRVNIDECWGILVSSIKFINE